MARPDDSVTFLVEARGAEPLRFQWRFNGVDLTEATNRTLILSGVALSQQGEYRVFVTNAFGTATSVTATLTVDAPPVPPVILSPPLGQKVSTGDSVSFRVVAGGSAPLTYQWRVNGTDISGAIRDALTLSNVTVHHSGEYRVWVGNAAGSIESEIAALHVEAPPPPPRTEIGALRALVDRVNYLPADTNTLFTVEGVVTTHTHLTASAGSLFFVQDSTGAIAVSGLGDRSLLPKGGDLVRVTAPLSHFNGLFEMVPGAQASDYPITVLRSQLPPPDPVVLDFSWQTNAPLMELHEGSLMIVSNVFLDLTPARFGADGENVTMTNSAGETFVLRIDGRTDIAGQAKPRGAVTILGVLGQSDGTNPRTSGYHLIPTRWADFIAAPLPPVIHFTNILENLIRPGDAPTNTFSELTLCPGEKWTLEISAHDPAGGDVTLAAVAEDWPTSGTWEFRGMPGTNPSARFMFAPSSSDVGSNYVIRLEASSRGAAERSAWMVYIPTAAEQHIVLNEFLPNPATSESASLFNPLRRAGPAPNPGSHDEFVEIVNLAAAAVDLSGWTLSDSTQVRHRFRPSFVLPASGAVVIYGGPEDGFLPSLPVPAIPANASASGLGLNNSGGDALWLRNAQGRLVSRVVFASVSANGSWTRAPELDGPFVVHSTVSTNAVSPGTRSDGRMFTENRPLEPAAISLQVSSESLYSVLLRWDAEAGRSYSVHRAATIHGPFIPLASGLSFPDGHGRYLDEEAAEASCHFYRVSTP